jgi:NodT family efflux transporter outer membrane factor (OMF) lipoprotein
MIRRQILCMAMLTAAAALGGCNVGPKYARPPVDSAPAYKELSVPDFAATDGWKLAHPSDSTLHGNWWEIFNEPELNTLETQLNSSNQNIAQAMANLTQARALVKEARAQLFPTLSVGAGITRVRNPLAGTSAAGTGNASGFNEYSLPFDASWVPDLWGRVRNTIAANVASAQVSAADLENIRLTAQAELAVDYFELRGQDALDQLLKSTVVAYQQSLDLTKALYETGIDSDESVAQAETQLEATQAQETNLGILRAELEHAIAALTGKPASSFSVAALPLASNPPAIPVGVPSQLLERRPDISAAERSMAQANAQIGVARAAYFPTVTLSATLGLESTHFTDWFTWPSRFWSFGPSVSETIFDAGLRKATVQQFRALYDADLAAYRQTVLTAFQQVEDNLSTLRILSVQIQQQDGAVKSADRNLGLATDRYRLGIDPYLNVITAQTTLLTNEQSAVNLRIQQMTASVQLVEALGGGWDNTQLPVASNFTAKSPVQPGAPAVTAAPAEHADSASATSSLR